MTLTGGDLAAIIAASASMVAAIGSLISVIMGLKNSRKIEQVHLATNGMKEELVKVTGDKRFAEGVMQGELSGKGRS